MKKFFKTLLILLLFTTSIMPFNAYGIDNEIPLTNSIINLKMDEQKLWIDHVTWTRSFIVSDLAALPDKEVVLQRLLKNQDDIGSSIKPYYGEEAGNKLSKLLREHITIAGQVVDSAKSNNKADLDKYNKLWYKNADEIADFLSSANSNLSNSELKDMLHKHLEFVTAQVVDSAKSNNKADLDKYNKLWYKNADDIADFLSSANPNWSNSELKDMLHKHLDIITSQVAARINKNWKADVEASDKGEDHMVKFADVLSDGIAKQFPEKLK